jgi:hypothetical protein
MRAPRESTFDRVLGGFGRVLEEVERGSHGRAGAEALGGAQSVALAWLIGRTLRPRRINWPRLIAATAAGVVLGEVLEAFTARRRDGQALPPGRSRVLEEEEEGAIEGDFAAGGPHAARAAYASEAEEEEEEEDEGLEEPGPRSARRARAEKAALEAEDPAARVRGILERAGGDLAVAAAYASVAYPRLPGPPFLRAAVFGAADVVVSSRGGVAATLADLSPRLRLPLARLLPEEERRVERALALALALGLIYRDEDDEDDEE